VRCFSVQVGRVIKSVAEVAVQDRPRIEHSNIQGNVGCIFPNTPVGVVPVLDYSSLGVSCSHEDSLRRLGTAAVHGLRVHDVEDETSFIHAMASGGAIDELVRTITSSNRQLCCETHKCRFFISSLRISGPYA
jgi:D-threo-aldose 1-dehydrogenase